MKFKRVFIHVGLPKTASTFLQLKIFSNTKNLRLVSMPYAQENHSFNKLQFADNTLYDPNELRNEINEIFASSVKNDTLLISNENLSGYYRCNFMNRSFIATRLAEVLPEAEIIIFLRAQQNIIPSLYNQSVKIGSFCSELDKTFITTPGNGFAWQAYLDGKRSWDIGNQYINHTSFMNVEHFRYSKLLDLYSGLFNKIHVFLYEDLERDLNSCLERLESLLYTKLPRPSDKRRVNQSLDNNMFVAKLIQNRLSVLSRRFQGRIGQAIFYLIGKGLFFRTKDRTSYLYRLLENQRIYEDNQRLDTQLKLGMKRYPRAYFNQKS